MLDLTPLKVNEYHDPSGWEILDIRENMRPTRAFVLQIHILSNHQNGKDTHIRFVYVLKRTALLITEIFQRSKSDRSGTG